MKPERELELDILIAEKVMGWKKMQDIDSHGRPIIWWEKDGKRAHPDSVFNLSPSYSTDIAAAWKVVNEVSCHSFQIYWEDDFGWKATFSIWNSDEQDFYEYTAFANSAPYAICVAALKTVEAWE